MEIAKLSDYQSQYDHLLTLESTLIFNTTKYLNVLEAFLEDEPKIAMIKQDDKLLAAIPFMEKDGALGRVINSLPFYGSNGGVVGVNPEQKKALLTAFETHVKTQSEIAAATLITDPLVDPEGYHLSADFKDERIGQFTRLDDLDHENLDEAVMALFHSKTRNMVRKGLKSEISVVKDNGQKSFLIDTHQDNMHAIGGIAKPKAFFDHLFGTLTEDDDYQIHIALMDGKPVAGLLTLLHKPTVEYYTPVVVADYRTYQPLSVIIFEAMKACVKQGYNCWNWGGTWASQESVYRFKNRWGATDKPYYYYSYLNNKEILNASPETLLSEYPYYFVLPFSELRNG